MKLHAREASITTVSVGIRALTVGNKQVTLAVFRQLQIEGLIDAEGHLRGNAWGWVNYFWGACQHQEHKHIVWQTPGEDLRRDCVYPIDNYLEDSRSGIYDLTRIIHTKARHLSWFVDCTWDTRPGPYGTSAVTFSLPDLSGSEVIEGNAESGISEHGRGPKQSRVDPDTKPVYAYGGPSESVSAATIMVMRTAFDQDLETRDTLRTAHAALKSTLKQSFETLEALPQLFIAV